MPRNHHLVHAILTEPWMIAIGSHNRDLIRVMVEGVLNPHLEPESSDPEQPHLTGTVKVIPITGVLVKYDVECGGYGMQTFGRIIQDAINDTSIDAIVLRIDSPGGMVSGTADLAAIIHNSTKPIVAYTDDLACSGAYWLASAASEIVANNDLATVGSIGVMCSWTDYQKYDDMNGIRNIAVAAPQSPDKLRMSEEMDKGDYTTLKERLSGIANYMIQTLISYRPSILSDQLTGNIYFAKDVVGSLVDSIGSLDHAVQRALTLAGEQSKNTNNQTQNSMTTFKFPRTSAAVGATELNSADGTLFLNEEQAAALEASLEPADVEASHEPAASTDGKVSNSGEVASSEVERLTSENARLAAENAALSTRITNLEASKSPASVSPAADKPAEATATTVGQAMAEAQKIANLYK